MFFPSSPLSALHPLKTVHVWRAASGPEMTSGSICSPSSLCSQPDKSAVLFFFLFVSRDSSVGPYCICITHKSDSYVTSHPLAVTLTSAELAAECWCDKSNRQTWGCFCWPEERHALMGRGATEEVREFNEQWLPQSWEQFVSDSERREKSLCFLLGRPPCGFNSYPTRVTNEGLV